MDLLSLVLQACRVCKSQARVHLNETCLINVHNPELHAKSWSAQQISITHAMICSFSLLGLLGHLNNCMHATLPAIRKSLLTSRMALESSTCRSAPIMLIIGPKVIDPHVTCPHANMLSWGGGFLSHQIIESRNHLAEGTSAEGGGRAIQISHDLDLAGLDLVVIQLHHAQDLAEPCRLSFWDDR